MNKDKRAGYVYIKATLFADYVYQYLKEKLMPFQRFFLIICFILPFSLFANQPDKRCSLPQDDAFRFGSGVFFDPYLICNTAQFKRIAKEPDLLKSHFILGQDISFKNVSFLMIGTETRPFTGGFDGNFHIVSDVRLNISQRNHFIAPFAYTQAARIFNLTLSHVILKHRATHMVGGMVGKAEQTVLSNVHVKHLNIIAPDISGGLAASIENSVVQFSSADGVLKQHFGTDASGGLIGSCWRSNVSRSYAKVDLTTMSKYPFGVSFIGGLVGGARDCVFTDVFAQGNIDYQYADAGGPRYIGGLIGVADNSIISHAYYAGKIDIKGTFIGGAIAGRVGGVIDALFWDQVLSGVSESEGGLPENTAQMQSISFWRKQHFDENTWILREGRYPVINLTDRLQKHNEDL